MLYYITLTSICNQRCIYCGNEGDATVRPINPNFSVEDIKNFIEEDPEPIICFYGGEPLLRIDLIKEIMDNVDADRFVLQTNGLLLDRLEDRYLRRLDVILVSIDGRREITDYYRGKGTYDSILRNIRNIRARGYKGELIARMAVSGKSDIYQEVTHLVRLENPRFDYVHWQLDVLWDYPPYQRYEDFGKWLLERYNTGITRLIEFWIDSLIDDSVIPGIIPFLAIMHTLLTGRPSALRCGSGINAFAISTDGKVLACPIAPEYRFNVIGDIYSTDITELPHRVILEDPCTSCSYLWVCGGRCLFANRTKLWGDDGFNLVCQSVKHLIDELVRYRDDVAGLVRRGVLSLDDFRYPKYPNSIEVVP